MSNPEDKPSSQSDEFMRQAGQARSSFLREYIYFLKNNKKWWMLPLAVLLLAFGILMVLSSTGVAPFIYTLF